MAPGTMFRRFAGAAAWPLALLARAWQVLRSHRRATLAVLALLVVGVAAALPWYAFRQWHAAQSAVKAERLDDARRSLDVCLLVWPRSVPVHLLAARAARLGGDFQGAEAHLNQCLQLHHGATEDIQLEFLLLRAQGGEADTVAPALLDYVKLKHPDTPLILQTLSRAYMYSHRYGPALVYLERWSKEAPEAALPLFWRGWVLERLYRHEEALKDYQRALELDPDLTPARLRLAEIYLERADPPAAQPLLERLRQQFPDRADVLARLGECRFQQGRVDEARPLMEAAVVQLPDDPALLIDLAKLDLQEGRPAEAEQWLRRALKADHYDVEAGYNLAACLRAQGRNEEANAALKEYEDHKAVLQQANRMLNEEMRNPSKGPAVPSEIGGLFLRMGQDRLGLYWLNQALERDPGHRRSHQVLAEYFERKGDHDKAAAHRRFLTHPGRTTASR
jgi:tetratricopeptide (TPR) repeat protein